MSANSITPIDTLQYGTTDGEWFIYKTGTDRTGTYIYIMFTSLHESRWDGFSNGLLKTYNTVYIGGDRESVYIDAGFTSAANVPAELQHFGAAPSPSHICWYSKCAAH